MKRMIGAISGILGLAMGTAAYAQQVGPTLEKIKQRGELVCGIHVGLPGFGAQDVNGNWSGLDIDLCRAVTVAIFDDPKKAKLITTTPSTRFVVVQTGDVDMLTRNATYTMSRDTAQGMAWPVINFFDGQGFMVKKAAKVASVKDLAGATICVTQGTTTELNLADYFRTNKLPYQIVTFGTNEEGVKALESGRCDSFTTDASGLAAERLKFAKPDDFVVLPELISREPLGPAIRRGDEGFAALVRWVHYAMLNAEDLGITQANVDQMRATSTSPEVRRLLGVEGTFGAGMGVTNDWAYRVIKHIGNYGEAFERNVGMGSRLQLKRGANDLWTRGGLQYPYPIR